MPSSLDQTVYLRKNTLLVKEKEMIEMAYVLSKYLTLPYKGFG